MLIENLMLNILNTRFFAYISVYKLCLKLILFIIKCSIVNLCQLRFRLKINTLFINN